MQEEIRFTLMGAPITKKNSQRIIKIHGRPCIIPSAQYKAYEKACLPQLPHLEEPIDYPVNVCCIYRMPTRRAVDLTNLLEATDDILVSGGVLKDDNCRIVAGHDGSRVTYDKSAPGVEVVIMPSVQLADNSV